MTHPGPNVARYQVSYQDGQATGLSTRLATRLTTRLASYQAGCFKANSQAPLRAHISSLKIRQLPLWAGGGASDQTSMIMCVGAQLASAQLQFLLGSAHAH